MEKETKEILEIVNFIKDRMMTKEEGSTKENLAETEQRLGDRITALESKVGGVHNRIDLELDKRLQIEVRVNRLESKVGA